MNARLIGTCANETVSLAFLPDFEGLRPLDHLFWAATLVSTTIDASGAESLPRSTLADRPQ